MKISLDWLSDYVDIDKSPQEIADILSDLGFPLEGLEQVDGDTVIDVEVSSNRGDCLSYIGIARELAAATGKKLKLPDISLPESDACAGDFVDVIIDEPSLCNRYTAGVITGVKIGPAPDWMAKRLEASGLRSVNNVVDATNYAMLETGQPPHAFDKDKLTGKKIFVRKGIPGEQMVSIDETKCDLNDRMLVIADEKGPVAIAGVMGGLVTEVSDTTTTILLEDAHFDPVSIRTTGRRLGISSEAAFRFERFIDTKKIDWASQRASQLITQVAGGTVAKGLVDAWPVKKENRTVAMRLSRLNKLLGIEIDKGTVTRIFTNLDFGPEQKKKDLISVTVPSWRHDIYREADLIEEAARSYGYDKIGVGQKINIEVTPVDKREKLSLRLRAFLNGCGFYETISVTFVDRKTAGLFAPGSEPDNLTVRDAASKSANLLRQNLIGSLLSVFKTNCNAGNLPCRIYELAGTFKPAAGESDSALPIEKTKIGFALDGDLRQTRGIIEGLIGVVSTDASVTLKSIETSWAKVAAEVITGEQTIGVCGLVSEKTAKEFDLPDVAICAAEIDFDRLLTMTGDVVKVRPIPRFPAVSRDLSLILDEAVQWADIIEAISVKAPSELEDVRFTGIYRGKPIPDGKKSMTVSLRFRDADGTLTHETVDGYENEILNELISALDAQLRTV